MIAMMPEELFAEYDQDYDIHGRMRVVLRFNWRVLPDIDRSLFGEHGELAALLKRGIANKIKEIGNVNEVDVYPSKVLLYTRTEAGEQSMVDQAANILMKAGKALEVTPFSGEAGSNYLTWSQAYENQ